MLEQHEIEHLLAVGEQQLQELMGVCSGTASGSDPLEAEAASAPPANMADSAGAETGP